MPKLNRNALTPQMVRHAGPGSYVHGNGLMLRVYDGGSRSWVQRLMVHGRPGDVRQVARAVRRQRAPFCGPRGEKHGPTAVLNALKNRT